MTKKIPLIIMLLITTFVMKGESTSNNEGVDVFSVQTGTQNSAEPRSESISADITRHVLTISFNDNVGIAHIIIKDSNGVYIDRENVFSTPDYATFFIDDAGYYRMDITLSNGEQYYGYFRVEP